ncbi:hypothetical protein HZB88_03105 [archaeon]|nr:hypothetical protein [archaeon]
MSVIVKILIGALLMVASVWWVFQGSSSLIGRSGLADILALINGGAPILVFLLGLFVCWLELDELRIEREIKSGEKKKK